MRNLYRSLRGFSRSQVMWATAATATVIAVAVSNATIPTTLRDFSHPGSQPLELQEIIIDSQQCWFCHGLFESPTEPHSNWSASMMGQASRDPMFWAALTVANQDADYAGEFCLRCHSPGGWMSGHSVPADGSALAGKDFDGVSCNLCHRMVDPVFTAGQSPADDADILTNLARPPSDWGNGQYVIDPLDRRRGPLDLDSTFDFHEWRHAAFQQSRSEMCGTCHEVSNPVLSKMPDGSYRPNPLNEPHPTGNRQDMFPMDRTYSEWKNSSFAVAPIDMGGRFGGDNPVVSTCQSCHMPTATGNIASPFLAEPRTNMPRHVFNGGNTWVLRAIRNLYSDDATYLTSQTVADSITRAEDMLAAAGDLDVSKENGQLKVRITNQSGHKLPTGYHEGRRMWINVKYFDARHALISEAGAYDSSTAQLTTSDTKVYENVQGMDAYMAALTGKAAGPSNHHALNNVVLKDNRIPPRGFTNAAFAAANAAPIGATYADGQYWDDTYFVIPQAARSAEVRILYQNSSKEYIDFLATENTTNNAGTILQEQWQATGKSAPVLMDMGTLSLCAADFNSDSVVDFFDYLDFVDAFSVSAPASDYNHDGAVDIFDYLDFLSDFATGCD